MPLLLLLAHVLLVVSYIASLINGHLVFVAVYFHIYLFFVFDFRRSTSSQPAGYLISEFKPSDLPDYMLYVQHVMLLTVFPLCVMCRVMCPLDASLLSAYVHGVRGWRRRVLCGKILPCCLEGVAVEKLLG